MLPQAQVQGCYVYEVIVFKVASCCSHPIYFELTLFVQLSNITLGHLSVHIDH